MNYIPINIVNMSVEYVKYNNVASKELIYSIIMIIVIIKVTIHTET